MWLLLQFLQEKVYDMKIYLLLCFEILQWTKNLQIVFKGVKKIEYDCHNSRYN